MSLSQVHTPCRLQPSLPAFSIILFAFAAGEKYKMASQDPRIRQIKIKTGVVKRLNKEKAMYEKEVKDQENKVENMKVDGKDEYDIKKQIEVLNESKHMIPDCKRRLKNAHSELTQLLEQEQDLLEKEDYKIAKEILQEISVQ